MSDEAPAPEQPAMEKPKPRRDWRSFGKEYVIVVLGVATALAAQQAADWLRWRGEVVQAREVIATELSSNLTGAILRLRSGACTERRLDELAQIVDAASKTGNLPPLGDIGLPPRSTWPNGAWESVVASQTATHFPREQLAAISGAYKQAQRLEDYSPMEIEAWDQLWTMAGPGRRLDPASESELRKALSDARAINRLFASLSIQLATRIKALSLPFNRNDLDRIAIANRWPEATAQYNICLPIGPPTAYYGQATGLNTTLPNGARTAMDAAGIDAAMKQIPDFSDGGQ